MAKTSLISSYRSVPQFLKSHIGISARFGNLGFHHVGFNAREAELNIGLQQLVLELSHDDDGWGVNIVHRFAIDDDHAWRRVGSGYVLPAEASIYYSVHWMSRGGPGAKRAPGIPTIWR